jgi:hypothetical protein
MPRTAVGRLHCSAAARGDWSLLPACRDRNGDIMMPSAALSSPAGADRWVSYVIWAVYDCNRRQRLLNVILCLSEGCTCTIVA